MSDLKYLVNDTINELNAELGDRPAITCYVIAKSLGHLFALPTSKVENPYKYFRDTHLLHLHEEVSKVNEEVVVDVDEVESLILKIWMMRYRLVHETNHPQVKHYIANLIKLGAADVPKPYVDLMNKYGQLTSNYADSVELEG